MANPQTENGFTKISNELFDQIIKADLSLRELKIIFTVIRFTYGFNRKEAELSTRFISNATGIKFQNIANSIKHLQNKNILVLHRGNHKQGRKIILNKNYELWNLNNHQKDDGSIIKIRNQKNDGFAQKDDGCVIEKMTETVIEKMTKKESKKKTLKKTVKKALPDLNLSSFTLKDFEPKTYEDHNHVRNKIEKVIKTFCLIEPNKSEMTRFFNIVMFTKRVNKKTAFNFLFETCKAFHRLEPAKANLSYLSRKLEGKIKDAVDTALKKADKQTIIIPGNGLNEIQLLKNKMSV